MKTIIVSNRLPITVVEQNGDLQFKPSVGGLATAINSYVNHSSNRRQEKIWIGWPGQIGQKKNLVKRILTGILHSDQSALAKQRLIEDYGAYPVFLSEKQVQDSYLGFCNRVVWPLFHELDDFVHFHRRYWKEYKKMNQKFCQQILKIAQPGDIVWVHDYQLLLLPQMLKRKNPRLAVSFFLHIPFPNFQNLKLLPEQIRKDLLQGMMAADIVGFHTSEYRQNFISSVKKTLNYQKRGEVLFNKKHRAQIKVYPIGINFTKFITTAQTLNVRRLTAQLKKDWGRTKTLLSIDRLDYTKGVVNRLKGYQRFLKTNPKWHRKVKLVLLTVPSREGIKEYQATKTQIEDLVQKINREFQTKNWQPILYQYKSVDFNTLVAYYNACDAMLVTPLRDGMNLVSKEFVASRADKKGVLILSKYAGAAKELTQALLVDPYRTSNIAKSIKQALEMKLPEQVIRNQAMQLQIKQNNVLVWANNQVKDLMMVRREKLSFAQWLFMDATATFDLLISAPNLLFINMLRLRLFKFLDKLPELTPKETEPVLS